MTWCLTKAGKKFDMANPKADQICIEDIAPALSKQCRFNGHCDPFYSVAQHCLHVSELVPDEHKLTALLHDATEAYIGDMVTPLKALIPDFKRIEDHLWNIISDKYKVPLILPWEVKRADLIALATEKRDLMPAHPEPWYCLRNIQPDQSTLSPMTPAAAETLFLTEFHRLVA